MLALIAANNAELLLRCGFTGAIGAGAAHYIDVTLKRAINQGLIQGPRMMACGRDLCTTGDSADFHPSWWKLQLESVGRV
jgi:imidazolonepropionase-like amidohydrolase